MASEIVLKVFNILVHYGEENSRNFRHLLEDGFFYLVDGDLVKNSRGKHLYIDKLSYVKCGNDMFMTGKLFKEAKIDVAYQRGEKNKAVNDPLVKDVYPFAYFFLDLVRHRIYWFYPKSETYPPQPSDLASYIKKKVYTSIKNEYEEQFLHEFEKLSKGEKSESFNDYKKRRALECNVTRKRFTVSAVPLVDETEVKKILRDKDYLIKSITVKGYLKNSTKRDAKELREWNDPFDEVVEKAKEEIGASFKGEFKPLDHGVIENREKVISMLDTFSEGKNYDLSVRMINIKDKKKSRVVHSNPDDDSHTDLGLKKIILCRIDSLVELVSNIFNINKEIREKISDEEVSEAVTYIEDAVAVEDLVLKEINVKE